MKIEMLKNLIKLLLRNSVQILSKNIINLLSLGIVSAILMFLISSFSSEAGLCFGILMIVLFSLSTTDYLSKTKLKTVKDKLFLGFSILINVGYYGALIFIYPIQFFHNDMWFPMFLGIIVAIILNFIHLWRILNACETIGTVVIFGGVNIILIEIILYWSVGMLMLDNSEWDKIQNFKLYFDQFIMTINVGIKYISQLPKLESATNTKHMLVYCLGSLTNAASMGFFISYITNSVFKLKNDNDNDNK